MLNFQTVYNEGPEYNGWNTKVARETGKTPGSKSNVTLYPLIDMIPSHPDTIKTALCEAMKVTVKAGQKYTLFTNDQPLYKVAVQLTCRENVLKTIYPDKDVCIFYVIRRNLWNIDGRKWTRYCIE